MNLEIVYLDPHDLTPYENNTRKHTPKILSKSRKAFRPTGSMIP